MKYFTNKGTFFLLLLCNLLFAQTQVKKISIQRQSDGEMIQVDGKNFFVKGMNWDYYPIGTNYTFILWNQSDEFIKTALDTEMKLLKSMGVNCIRVYTGIPPKWITYIYDHFGIYTMLNHAFGRYGLMLDGQWVANTDYGDLMVEKLLLEEVRELADIYKNTNGLLIYLLGNENNYGLFWEGAATENIPTDDQNEPKKPREMYRLFNNAAKIIHEADTSHLVALCNGDVQFLNLIARECTDFDIFGSNIYRGKSFGDVFEKVKKEYGKPILFTEFGADAFNMKTKTEDQDAQSMILKNNWLEIYENAAGLGKTGNCLGGFTFQFSDGWWKYDQTYQLDVHDTIASWTNGGYLHDFMPDQNNMNEEWFGICAKGVTDNTGHYKLSPRLAYNTLKMVHKLDPLKKCTTLRSIKKHFDNIR